MKKVILIVLGVIVLLVVGFLAVVAMKPDEFSVTRKATLPSPPAVVFAQVNNFQNWQAWSPWAKLDPDAKNTFEGPEQGEGAKFHWDGNDKVGAGTMTITESKPDEHIKMRLEFKKPMEDECDTDFAFTPVDGGESTDVVWSMSGEQTFVGKAMCMFMNMDKMVGGSFEEGLANLKDVSEKAEVEASVPATETPATETPGTETSAEEPAAEEAEK